MQRGNDGRGRRPSQPQNVLVNDYDYDMNRARIQYLQGILDGWKETNEHGHNEYNKVTDEMTQIVQRGEEAKRALENLHRNRPGPLALAPFAPPAQHLLSHLQNIVITGVAIEEVHPSPIEQAFSSTSSHSAGPTVTQLLPSFSERRDRWGSADSQHAAPLPGTRFSYQNGNQSRNVNVGMPSVQQHQQHQRQRQHQQQQQQQQQQSHQHHRWTQQDQEYQEMQRMYRIQQQQQYASQQPYQYLAQQQPPPQPPPQPQPQPQPQYGSSQTTSTFHYFPQPQPQGSAVLQTTSSLSGALDLPQMPRLDTTTTTRVEHDVTQGGLGTSISPIVVDEISPVSDSGVQSEGDQNALVDPPFVPTPPSDIPATSSVPLEATTSMESPVEEDTIIADPDPSIIENTASSSPATLPSSLPPPRTIPPILLPSSNNGSGRGQPNAPGQAEQNLAAFFKHWRDALQPNCSLMIPNTNAIMYKDDKGRVRILPAMTDWVPKAPATAAPPAKNRSSNSGTFPLPPQTKEAPKPVATAAVPLAENRPSNSGIFPPRTPEQPYYRPHANYDQDRVEVSGDRNAWLQWTTPQVPRTPAHVDRTRLAKDVLRSLGFSSGKGKGRRVFEEQDHESPRPKRLQLEKSTDAQLGTDITDPAAAVTAASTADPTTAAIQQNIPESSVTELAPLDRIGGEKSDDLTSVPAAQGPPPPPLNLVDTSPIVESPTVAPAPATITYEAIPPTPENRPAAQPPPSKCPTPQLSGHVSPGPLTVSDNSSPHMVELEFDDIEVNATTVFTSLPSSPTPTPPPPSVVIPERKPIKEPLFLPSPDSSPRAGARGFAGNVDDGDDDEVEIVESWTHMASSSNGKVGRPVVKNRQARPGVSSEHRRKEQRAYVLVPSLPSWARKAGKSKGVGPNDAEYWEAEVTKEIDPAEVAALQRSYLQLIERSCKWRGCKVVMNSIDNLHKHVVQHIKEKKLFDGNCLWGQCTKRFSDMSKMTHHLESHAQTPIVCAFKGCDESFRRPRELIRHNYHKHANDYLKPLANPFKPPMPESLDDVPQTLPVYQIEPRYVSKAYFTKEHHISLGEWVLRNIMAPIVAMKKSADVLPRAAYNEYDFLAKRPRSPTKMPVVEDLDSAEVSQMVHEGMVFWGPEEPEAATEVDLPEVKRETTLADPITADDDGEKDGLVRGQSVLSEEMTVETMLGVVEGVDGPRQVQ